MTTRPGIPERAALLVLQLGVLAVVLAAAPYKAFDLDRFFVPKELVLHVTALVASVLCLLRARRIGLGRVDQLLALFLAVGACSALLASNWWLAGRAVAVSLAGAACFWCARALSRAGLARPLLAACAVAGIVGAVTALLQAYGLTSEFVSLNRAPGGTFGNRNFMAHLCVITMPALVLVATTAGSRRAFNWWAGGLALVAGALILSRSRAAWLALIVGAVVLLPLAVLALRTGRGTLRLGRLLALPVAAVAGSAAALVLPNTLDWRSDSPYMDTAKSVVNYKEGSGRGRLVQYGNSLKMSVRHPLLGVGPGNWAVVYPRFAARNDPSLSDDGMTSNPWPSSDWMTFVSERGIASFVLLALAMIALVADGLRAVRNGRTPEERLAACTLLGTLAILLVVGTFDAVLLLPVPALVAWALVGALASPTRERKAVALPLARRVLALVVITGIGGLAIVRSASQLSAMSIFSTTSRVTRLEQASATDPGSYRIHVRLADGYARRGNCRRAIAHATSARALFPNASQPRRILTACGG
ncbi:MAG TPA: O-antigen ligase family protein [Gemmatimonadaceae bacterium]|nr:O-antigen ligase family protein [Gemmatimonadaceae bacterium]